MIIDENIDDLIQESLRILQNGGVIISPTDTIYGIICDANNAQAIEKIYQIKERSYDKPLTIFSNSCQNIQKITNLNEIEQKIIDNFMPGALSLVANGKENDFVKKDINKNDQTISVRIPNNQFLLKLMAYVPFLASTSANISGQDSLINTKEIQNQFKEQVDLVINCGTIDNKASTIVRIINNNVKILRQGVISQQQIMAVL